ncbi:hypothetical protein ACHAWX_001256, partial [Stephanocyclus meneghinianus]
MGFIWTHCISSHSLGETESPLHPFIRDKRRKRLYKATDTSSHFSANMSNGKSGCHKSESLLLCHDNNE